MELEYYEGTEIPGEERVIGVNLPNSQKFYENGNGEGMYAYIISDDDFNNFLDNSKKGMLIKGFLLNNSLYYPGLKWGLIVPIELRGSKKPVVPLEFLQQAFKEVINRKKKKSLK